jgi:hypothetical protein
VVIPNRSRKKKEKSSAHMQPDTPRPPTTANLSKRRKEAGDHRKRHMEISVIGEKEIIGKHEPGMNTHADVVCDRGDS